MIDIDKSPEAIAERRRISDEAIANIGLEGLVLDDFARELDEMWVRGEINNAERLKRLHAQCRREQQ